MQSTHPLKSTFIPRSVAVVGASDRQGSRGTYIWKSVMNSRRIFEAYPINPKYKYIGTTPCWEKLADLPIKVDLVVIAISSHKVISILEQCAKLGISNVLITPGSEQLTSDRLWREKIAQFAYEHHINVLGPDSTGIIRTSIGLNVSYIPELPSSGHVGFIAQSSSIAATVIDYAKHSIFGFSSVMTSGAEADITITDMIEFLNDDPETSVIAVHLETIANLRKFYLALNEAARKKPIVILKTSSNLRSKQIIASRLACTTGDDSIFNAMLDRIGVIRTSRINEFCSAIEILNAIKPSKNEHLTVLTNGLGYATLIANETNRYDITLEDPSPETTKELHKTIGSIFPETNPINLGSEATSKSYETVLKILLEDPHTQSLMLAVAPTPTIDIKDLATTLKKINESTDKLIFTALVQHVPNPNQLQHFISARIPTFNNIDSALDAFNCLSKYEKARKLSKSLAQEGYESNKPNLTAARNIIEEARSEHRFHLTEAQSIELLQTFGIASASNAFASNANDACYVAKRLGYPVAVKLCADGIAHKLNYGGVKLNCQNEADVIKAFNDIRSNSTLLASQAHFRGVLVQSMVHMPNARSLSIEIIRDPVYGPAIKLGAGGLEGEVYPSMAVAALPLTEPLARDLILRCPVAHTFGNFRGQPNINFDILVRTLLGLSRLITELPSVLELSINPLFIDNDSVKAIDCAVTLNSRNLQLDNQLSHMVIGTASSGIEHTFDSNLGEMLIRSVRSDDNDLLHRFISSNSSFSTVMLRTPDDRQQSIDIDSIVRIDFSREKAFVICENNKNPPIVYGLVYIKRASKSPISSFNMILDQHCEKHGFALQLLSRIENEAKKDGIELLRGYISKTVSTALIEQMKQSGYRVSEVTNDNTVLTFVKVL